jgi:murein DD-endopeptidase MepM/ murein hydrolase activator NlpD
VAGTSHGRAAVLSQLSVSRSRIYAYGAPARVTFEIDSRARTLPVTLDVYSGASRVASIALGTLATGAQHSYALHGEALPSGRLTVRVRTPRLRARARAAEILNRDHCFPLAGPFTWPGAAGRFGAGRPGHVHQGFDLLAAEGTPVVAPRGGTVTTVAYQAAGAGFYVVLSGAGESYDYAFMHLEAGSVRVHAGQRIATAARIGNVGATGDASGSHLHFEVWQGPWQAGGRPTDPLPLLRQWLAT